jgi:hypothetical protein
MFFNGDPDPNRKGVCPAGGPHRAQGFVFYLPHDVAETVGQPGWSFCDRCFGMFFSGNPPEREKKGVCPAGGPHNPQGFLFVLPHRDFPNPRVTLSNLGRQIKAAGIGFEPNQRVKLDHEFSSAIVGDGQSSTDMPLFTSDSTGSFIQPIDLSPALQGASDLVAAVIAFDFGSGETRRAQI